MRPGQYYRKWFKIFWLKLDKCDFHKLHRGARLGLNCVNSWQPSHWKWDREGLLQNILVKFHISRTAIPGFPAQVGTMCMYVERRQCWVTFWLSSCSLAATFSSISTQIVHHWRTNHVFLQNTLFADTCFPFPGDRVRKKDGWISCMALVSARGSSKDRSHDPVTYPFAESAVCQRRPSGMQSSASDSLTPSQSWMPED